MTATEVLASIKQEPLMKKNPKKLHLSRETLARLDSQVLVSPLGGAGAAVAIVTSCTYACDCPTGCSAEQACMDNPVIRA